MTKSKRQTKVGLTNEAMASTFKLTTELVPQTIWRNNLRSMVKRPDWDKLRYKTYADYGHKCGICGIHPDRLECHEIWEYDDTHHIQHLKGLITLCVLCHHIKHLGRANIDALDGRLDYDELVDHFMTINNCSEDEFFTYRDDIVFPQWKHRSKYQWTQDFGEYTNLIKVTNTNTETEAGIEQRHQDLIDTTNNGGWIYFNEDKPLDNCYHDDVPKYVKQFGHLPPECRNCHKSLIFWEYSGDNSLKLNQMLKQFPITTKGKYNDNIRDDAAVVFYLQSKRELDTFQLILRQAMKQFQFDGRINWRVSGAYWQRDYPQFFYSAKELKPIDPASEDISIAELLRQNKKSKGKGK